MPAVYIYLFYLPVFRNNATNHFFIVSGYDPQRSAIQIQDTVRDFVIAPGLYPLQMHESLLKGIWTNSNNFFKEKSQDFLCNNFFSIEKPCKSRINSYYDLIADFLANYSPENSELANTVKHFPRLIYSVKNNDFGTTLYLKRELCHTTAVLFDCLEKAFYSEQKDVNKLSELHVFKEQYITFRDKTVTKIYAEALREKNLAEKEKESIINDILFMDRKLFSFVKSLSERGM